MVDRFYDFDLDNINKERLSKNLLFPQASRFNYSESE